MIYDENPSFSFLYMDSTPKSTVQIDVVYSNAATVYDLDITQEVFFDTSLNLAATDFDDQLRLTFSLSDNSF